jgi:CheY-like chemotaxis protein
VREEMEGQLRIADSDKNQFLATLAHELRNPLSPIRNAAALLETRGDGLGASELRERAREVILRQVDHLAHLVDDLLDVARISEGKIVLRNEEVDLRKVIAQATDTLAPLVTAHAHRLEVIQPNEKIWVQGDPARLAQSVGNLLHNAIKFTRKGGEIVLTVEVTHDDRVRISLRDNGIGIAAEDLQRIFGMFVQAAAPPDLASEGLGIGLPLVAHVLKLHGGRLTAESKGKNMGSTFTIDLPVLRVTSSGQDIAIPKVAGPRKSTGARVLLVDDNVDSLEVMGLLLAEIGYDVHTTSDPSKIEVLALHLNPQVIVLDIGLPGTDGYELARRIKRNPQLANIRLVAHTGYGSPEDRNRAQEAGFDAHLVKPANLSDLDEALGGG